MRAATCPHDPDQATDSEQRCRIPTVPAHDANLAGILLKNSSYNILPSSGIVWSAWKTDLAQRMYAGLANEEKTSIKNTGTAKK